jgi:hypothetical protein
MKNLALSGNVLLCREHQRSNAAKSGNSMAGKERETGI